MVLTQTEVDAINALCAEKDLPPLHSMKITNEEVVGELREHDVLYFGYQLFEYGKDREGYWNSEKMVEHTKEMIWILEFKYPGKKFVFLFDWSSGHDKKPVDAPILSNMQKVHVGGKQAKMRP